MDHHLKDFYGQYSDDVPHGNFHSVINLNENTNFSWEKAKAIVPDFSRGWFELSHLKAKDRIEFSRDFWLSKLPYREGLNESLIHFFDSLDDMCIFFTQKKFDDPYEANLVYSIKNNGGFFRGALPANEKNLIDLQKAFSQYILPVDYLAFLQIHNGFCKATDCTGITAAEGVFKSYENLQLVLQQQSPILTSRHTIVDPKSLIPFYESFGMPYYQCFWAEWYFEQEMGNVYYSGATQTISDVYSGFLGSETMAFPTFTDWLMFYLERVE
jgi:hypothetical protein